jgi:HEPN domain-containing protein
MRPNQKKESERWMRQALRDLDDAKYNLQGERYNLVCFLAQQAAEKALKAYLYGLGQEEAWGHSVVDLCQEAQGFDEAFAEIKKHAASLDTYYIPTRYPNGLPGGIPAEAYTEEVARQALKLAQEVLEFVQPKLG